MTAEESLGDLSTSARRMLRAGQDFWLKYGQHDHEEGDEMAAALTDLYYALVRNGFATE